MDKIRKNVTEELHSSTNISRLLHYSVKCNGSSVNSESFELYGKMIVNVKQIRRHGHVLCQIMGVI